MLLGKKKKYFSNLVKVLVFKYENKNKSYCEVKYVFTDQRSPNDRTFTEKDMIECEDEQELHNCPYFKDMIIIDMFVHRQYANIKRTVNRKLITC